MNSELHEGCQKRGGVCDCPPRHCYIDNRAKIEQEFQNKQVKELQRTGKCPCCGCYSRIPDDDSRYEHLSGKDRQEAIRESNQRAGGDIYGG